MKIIKSKISIIIIVAIIVIASIVGVINARYDGPKKIKSASKLESIYGYEDDFLGTIKKLAYCVIAAPWIDTDIFYDYGYSGGRYSYYDSGSSLFNTATSLDSLGSTTNWYNSGSSKTTSGSNDFSKTNIQVENVDEADVIKTDGEYIYSLSDNQVIITDATDPQNTKVVFKLTSTSYSGSSPEEILLYGNNLIVIGTKSGPMTTVEVYDITSKENPYKKEAYCVNGRYYTSRLTDGKLYVLSTGHLEESDGKVDNTYIENSVTRYIDYNDIYYFNNRYTTAQTTITTLDLDKEKAKVDVSMYLLALDNIYVSQNNMYLVADRYYESNTSFLGVALKLLGPKGIIGEAKDLYEDYDDYSYDDETTIYKFALNNGKIKYVGKAKEMGETIDQFSLDEYDSNLRVALHTDNGSKVVIFNNNMKKIGESESVAKGEKMYSSRFIGDRGYLVTYLNTDPLFCIDLSDPKNPEMLGELQISGYSTYLHPYDENHLIGIGYESEVKTNRNSQGKVTSQYAVITGMKMALFDVSNINNPIKIADTKIGDKYTRSAILTNHKALLFSKEKGIIAIPVNTYEKELEITSSNGDLSSLESSYTTNSKEYKTEGYLVYGINLDEGFIPKGFIEHSEVDSKSYSGTNLIRGVYIKDWLFTVSQGMIKVNKLDTLEQVASVLIEGVE